MTDKVCFSPRFICLSSNRFYSISKIFVTSFFLLVLVIFSQASPSWWSTLTAACLRERLPQSNKLSRHRWKDKEKAKAIFGGRLFYLFFHQKRWEEKVTETIFPNTMDRQLSLRCFFDNRWLIFQLHDPDRKNLFSIFWPSNFLQSNLLIL